MTPHSTLSPLEAADRLAIRELFDAYASCADRRDAEGQKALFTADTRFAVYMDGPGSEPSYVLEGREALSPVFDDLNRYEVTMHFNGQSTVRMDGERARRGPGERRQLHDRPPRLHRSRQPQDDGGLAALPRRLRQGRRPLVHRRSPDHPRMERDASPWCPYCRLTVRGLQYGLGWVKITVRLVILSSQIPK